MGQPLIGPLSIMCGMMVVVVISTLSIEMHSSKAVAFGSMLVLALIFCGILGNMEPKPTNAREQQSEMLASSLLFLLIMIFVVAALFGHGS